MKNEKIIKICEQKFIYLNYSKRTQDNYMSHIKRFIESIIVSTYRAMLTNLKNGWTSLEDMEKLKQKCLDKEQYEECVYRSFY